MFPLGFVNLCGTGVVSSSPYRRVGYLMWFPMVNLGYGIGVMVLGLFVFSLCVISEFGVRCVGRDPRGFSSLGFEVGFPCLLRDVSLGF